MGFEQSIEAATYKASEGKKNIYTLKWWSTRYQWAYYACQHSCLLLQCMTTNSVTSLWSIMLKAKKLEPLNTLLVLVINGNYKLLIKLQLSFVLRGQWNVLNSPAIWHYFQAQYKCLYIVAQLNKAIKAINEDESSATQLPDNPTCQCRFYRLYQLSCSHIWQYHLFNNVITRTLG